MIYTKYSVATSIRMHSYYNDCDMHCRFENKRFVTMLKVATLLCIVALFLCSCSRDSTTLGEVVILTEDSDNVLFHSNEPLSNLPAFEADRLYKIKNDSEKPTKFIAFYDDNKTEVFVAKNTNGNGQAQNGVFELDLAPKSSCEFEFRLNGAKSNSGWFLGWALELESGKYFYAASEECLRVALDSGVDIVTVTEKIKIDGDLILDRPMKMVLFEQLEINGEFVFEYEGKGSFSIDNNANFLAKSFFVEAAECDITVKRDIFEENKNLSYCVRAKSYNGKQIIEGKRVVSDEEELERLIDPLSYPKLREGDKLFIDAPVFLKQDVLVDKPISISANNNIAGSGRIILQTEAEGEIYISDCEMANLLIDAPRCSLSWDGEMAPDEESCAMFYNVANYNGKSLAKYGLGGTGKNKLTKLVMYAEDNSGLEDDVVWEIAGNCLFATVDFALSDSVLKNAKLSATIDGGEVYFEGIDTLQSVDLTGEDYCVVADDEGKIRRYLVVTSREIYDIPAVFISTDGGKDIVSKDEYIKASFRFVAGDTGFSDIESEKVLIRGRGHSSWNWEKKPYKIKFDKKISLFGLERAKEWVLLANYSDKSLIRNHLAMELGRVLDNLSYTPHQYLVDVFLNGEYIGVYTLGEQIEVKRGRVEISENYDDPNTGYLLEVGGAERDDVLGKDYFHTETIKYIRIKSPDTGKMSSAHFDYISEYFQKTDEAIRTLTDYENYIDVDSFVDWVIMYELSYNFDGCFRRSCYITKEKDGKLKMGPIWDFDLAFGNFVKDNPGYDDWASVGSEGEYVGVTWINYLLDDEEFRQRLRERWDSIKEKITETAERTITMAANDLEHSQKENFKVWNILGRRAGYESAYTIKYDTFESQIEYLSDFISKRIDWLDKNI